MSYIVKSIEEFAGKLLPNKRLMSIDLGSKNIGIAISDRSYSFSTPLSTVKYKNITQAIDAIHKLCIEQDICGIAIGLPFELGGNEGNIANHVKNFAEKLADISLLPIIFVDERLSSKMADNMLRTLHNMKRHKRELVKDKIAAAIIMDTILNMCRRLNG